MHAIFESLVTAYLTHKGDTFVCPQFPVNDENGNPWSCPDLVALNFPNKRIEIVEVTTAYDVSKLIEKVRKREGQWYGPLRQHLTKNKIADDTWGMVVRVFVRKDRLVSFDSVKAADVSVEALEDRAFAWQWPWASKTSVKVAGN